MTHYINKEALVAEIKKRIKEVSQIEKASYEIGLVDAYKIVLSFLNTIEVKEVDLEKEATHYLLHEHLSPLNNILHQADLKTEMQYHKDIESAFKAGYELGLSVNNLITAANRGMAEEIIINLKRVEQDYRIDLTKEMEWLRNKVKKTMKASELIKDFRKAMEERL